MCGGEDHTPLFFFFFFTGFVIKMSCAALISVKTTALRDGSEN